MIPESKPQAVKLSEIPFRDIPEVFKISFYFDLQTNTFTHKHLFTQENVKTVIDVIPAVNSYLNTYLSSLFEDFKDVTEKNSARGLQTSGSFSIYAKGKNKFIPASIEGRKNGKGKIFLAGNTNIHGVHLDVSRGSIYFGEETVCEPGSYIRGPAVIGRKNIIRAFAYFRGNILTGDECVFRCEAKNAVFLSNAEFPHPSYVGDSILGFRSHFGNQAATSNYSLFNSISHEKQSTVKLSYQGSIYDTGLRKMGIILGDSCQIGCSTVTDPGTLLGPSTIVYPLSRVTSGFYGPEVIIKNNPLRKGVMEVFPLKDQ